MTWSTRSAAGSDEGDLSRLVDSVAGGDAAALETELSQLHAEGQEGITVLRAMLRRIALLTRLRAEVERGSSVSAVMASQGKSLFWKEKDNVERQVGRWRADLLAKAMSRLLDAERQVKASGGVGPLAADAELFGDSGHERQRAARGDCHSALLGRSRGTPR
jgi:DNA polymerase-3 subunit delta